MKFSISRDALIKPLNLVAGVVERRQTLPILSNVLLVLEGTTLSLTGTDLEVELVGRVELESAGVDGEVTVPARKLVDICKSLPEGSTIEFSLDSGKAIVKAGRSRFTLSTLPAADFPAVEGGAGSVALSLDQSLVKHLIDGTAFAMAQQDVRYRGRHVCARSTQWSLCVLRLRLRDFCREPTPLLKTGETLVTVTNCNR